MADKEKRLRKILDKLDLRGILKRVRTLEESHLVLVENTEVTGKCSVYKKEDYKKALEDGHTYSEDRVHFLIASNPRNRRLVVQSLMINRYGLPCNKYRN